MTRSNDSDDGGAMPANTENEETIDSLAAEFNSWTDVINEHHIKKGMIAFRAKRKDDKQAKGKGDKKIFQEFCEKTRSSSSTVRKYEKIGGNADWLEQIIAYLPTNNWTTIYDLAVLGKAKAEELISRGVLHPQATARQLQDAAKADALAPGTATEGETSDVTEAEANDGPEPCVFRIDATSLTDEDRLKLYRDLVDAVLWLDLTVTGLPDRLAAADIIGREAA